MRLAVVRPALVLLAGCLAVPLAAQQPRRPAPAPAASPPQQQGRGSVSGVVFDSLSRAPLEGAHVWIAGTTISAATDAGGRFRLDSVQAGSVVIAFEHEALDSIGLSNNARRITVLANRMNIVELAVPSQNTLRRAVCATAARAGAPTSDSGVVFGTVREVESGVRLAGARVVVQWTTATRLPDGNIQVGRPVLTSRTDSIGNYYTCGVPTQYVVTVLGQAGRFSSGATELLLGQRGIARRDLDISRDSTQRQDTTGRRSGRAVLIGTVTDDRGQPRPSARASIDDAAAGEAFSNEDGKFTLNNLPAGSQMLMVRMIGYSAVRLPVLLKNDDTVRVAVSMRSLTVLDSLTITVRSQWSQNQLSDLAMRQRMGLGYFLPGEQVKTRPDMRSVFQGLPALTVENVGASAFNYRLQTLVNGSPCPVNLWVDGFRTDPGAMQSYRPDQIIMVEWYPRGNQAPLQYLPAGGSTCGVMLVWTRFL